MSIRVINNITDLNHEKIFNDLLIQCDNVLISSPFLMADFDFIFNKKTTENLKSIQVITTLQPKSLDQLKKINSLVSLIQLPKIKNGDWNYKISLNNKLHGKVYIFRKEEECFSAIITSANFTYNGLILNHEWGIEITDKIIISEIQDDLIKSIEPAFEDISSSYILFLKKQVEDFLKENNGEQNDEIDLDLTKLLVEKQKEDEEEKQLKNRNPRIRTNEYKITPDYIATWERYFDDFLEFKKKTNEVTVPRGYQPYSLYSWYRKQKVFYSNGQMPPEHRGKLEKVGFYFGDGHELFWAKIWEDNYGLLEAYYQEYGTSNVPHTRDNTDTFYSLGNWVAAQKTYSNNGVLSDYKIERLNDLDFIWKKEGEFNPSNNSFNTRLNELKEWKDKYGDCHVPQFNPDKTKNSLGRWLNDQRVLKRKGKKNSVGKMKFLEEERELILLEIGVDFDYEENKHKNSFEKQVQSFLSFRYQYPDLKAPSGDFKKERECLYQWRHNFEELPEYKQKRLNELKIIE